MRIATVLLFLIAVVVPGSAFARKHEIVDPAPVAVPAGMTTAAVATEIKRSLAGRTWTVANETPGHIDATLHLRKHVARIAIAYDASSVRISYVASENLDYKEKGGKRYIHGNYLSWITNLATDLARNLQIAQQMK
jgi:hypothetical protein